LNSHKLYSGVPLSNKFSALNDDALDVVDEAIPNHETFQPITASPEFINSVMGILTTHVPHSLNFERVNSPISTTVINPGVVHVDTQLKLKDYTDLTARGGQG